MDTTQHRGSDLFGTRSSLDWQERLAQVVTIMREMSTHTDPQEMVRAYGRGSAP